jgi:hypothetical protein
VGFVGLGWFGFSWVGLGYVRLGQVTVRSRSGHVQVTVRLVSNRLA